MAVVLATLAVGLTNDAGPSRLSLTKASFAELSGWADADVTATLPALVKALPNWLAKKGYLFIGLRTNREWFI